MSTPYDKLLNEVCVRLGFCGSVFDNKPLHVGDLLPKSGRVSPELFASALFRAEGMDPEGPAAQGFRPAIHEAFVRHMGSTDVNVSLLK